jgi:hypothetical protein
MATTSRPLEQPWLAGHLREALEQLSRVHFSPINSSQMSVIHLTSRHDRTVPNMSANLVGRR